MTLVIKSCLFLLLGYPHCLARMLAPSSSQLPQKGRPPRQKASEQRRHHPSLFAALMGVSPGASPRSKNATSALCPCARARHHRPSSPLLTSQCAIILKFRALKGAREARLVTGPHAMSMLLERSSRCFMPVWPSYTRRR
jgi:hypothetical protein